MPENVRPLPPPVVLIANDQEWAARSLESILGPQGYAVLRTYTGRQALELARSIPVDVIILDLRLPDIDGIEVCRQLREEPAVGPHTPIVITASDQHDGTRSLEAYRAGAWEFFSPPMNGDVLLSKLGTFLRSKRGADRLRDESLLDQPTGLYNVRGLARRAREIGADASRQGDALACIAFSTDSTEEGAAEEFAARVAEHMSTITQRTARMSDVVGRLGTREFAIIAPATQAEGVLRLIERLQASVAREPLSVDGEQRTLKIRAAYCAVSDFAESSVDAVEILLRAAAALRETRRGDGGPVRAFADSSSTRFVQ